MLLLVHHLSLAPSTTHPDSDRIEPWEDLLAPLDVRVDHLKTLLWQDLAHEASI